MVPFLLFALFLIVIDVYSFFGIRNALLLSASKVFYILYFATSLITVVGVLLLVNSSLRGYSIVPTHVNVLFGIAFSFIIAKLFSTSIFFLEDIFRGFIWMFQSSIKFRMVEMINRGYWSGITVIAFGALSFIVVNYGVWFTRYNFKTHYKTVEFSNLPESFDGLRICQISDLHLGTFDQLKKVKRGLQQIQNEKPDIILFTGDMVNNKSSEASPFIDMFRELTAPLGKFAILGNHDYGDYAQWKSTSDKADNLKQLQSIAFQMGFQGLYNSQLAIAKGNDTINIVGIENWGEPPFPQYGNLKKAIGDLSDKDFIILLSHDPSHWRHEVLKTQPKIELTLSGHTHGMQFGIEIGKFRWSPVKYKYAEWADLFEENGQYLYVNRGFGSIGYPGRIGIRPEITIIELKKKR